ncbi:MAG TPA: DUF1698 domain-containing protein [bacterium]|nr:DUF1698 domain-containing protein [bacterium]
MSVANLKINEKYDFDVINDDDFVGHFALIHRGEILDQAKELYGRENNKVCLKIFYKRPITGDINNYFWGNKSEGKTVLRSSQFQNICYVRDLSPRVYDVFIIVWEDRRCVAQLVEDLGKHKDHSKMDWKTHEETLKKVIEINDEFGGNRTKKLDRFVNNSINGKYVDLQSFGLDKRVYAKYIRDLVDKNLYGRVYQTIPEIGVNEAFRDTGSRLADLGIDEISFEGKTVLDLGCSNGQFCNYAYSRGAKRVVGVDLPWFFEPAFHLSNYLGNFNIDYFPLDLKKTSLGKIRNLTKIEKFDIVFFLSMITHVDFPEYIKELVGELLVFEESGMQTDFMTSGGGSESILNNNFSNVEYRGHSRSHNRKVFWARR